MSTTQSEESAEVSPEFRFGISSWSYPWAVGVVKGPQPKERLTALGLLQKAKAMGVGLVQIADNLPLEKLSPAEIDGLKDYSETEGVGIEIGTKGIEPDHMLQFLELAKTLGSPIVRTLPAIFGDRVPIESVRESLCQVLDAYRKAGVRVVLENQEAYSVSEYATLMKEVDDPCLRICLDLSNALGAMEGPGYAMECMGPYCGNFHVKDVVVIRAKTLMGFTVEGRPAGEGSLPIQWALEQIHHYGKHPSVIIEQWPPLQDTLEATIALEDDWAKKSVEFMRTLDWPR